MQIGSIDLGEKPVFLAPMEDVTDPSFRYICKKFGADMMYTEFVASEALIRDIQKTKKKLKTFDYERPVGIQLYGHLVDSMAASAKIAEEYEPDLIDINFGCPVKKIANRGAGAGLLRNVPLMVEMASAIVGATKLPVTAKTRLGWDDESKNIIEVAHRLQDSGIKALTIHGRTRAQLYKGTADWTLIGELKSMPSMKIPIIGNGDIHDPVSAKEAFEQYHVDGIMIGRAAIGKPWIFRDVKHYLNTGELLPELTIPEKVDLAREQLQKAMEWKGEVKGMLEMRRHFCNYFKGLPNFKETRLELVTTLELQKIHDLLDYISETYKNVGSPE